MELYKFVMPLGIAAYTLLLITMITGIKKVKLKYHKVLALIMLALATLHALIVIVG